MFKEFYRKLSCLKIMFPSLNFCITCVILGAALSIASAIYKSDAIATVALALVTTAATAYQAEIKPPTRPK